MKGRVIKKTQAIRKDGVVRSFCVNTEVHFSIPDFSSRMIDVDYCGCEYKVNIEDIAATEVETLADVNFAMQLQEEMEQHERIMVIEELYVFAPTGYYIYADETLSESWVNSMANPIRRLMFPLAKKIAIDADVKAFILADSKDSGYLNLFGIKDAENYVKLGTFKSLNRAISYFIDDLRS